MFVKDIKALDKFSSAPKVGSYLIYTRKEVKYGDYNDLSFLDKYQSDEILELHLFDENKEYRVISSRTKGPINTLLEGSDNCIIDEISLEKPYGDSINLISYIEFDDNGIARVSNYRLGKVK